MGVSLVGPQLGFGLIHGAESIEIISEIGLILLLFIIGLEMNLKAILAVYSDDGISRIQRLEVNFDADLRRLDIETQLISADDFLRGAQWS